MYDSVICPSKIIKSNFLRKINKSRLLGIVCVTFSEVFFVSRCVSIILLQGCIYYTTHTIGVNPINETFKQLHHRLLKRETNVMSQICELCLQDRDPLFSFLRLSGSFLVCLGPVF